LIVGARARSRPSAVGGRLGCTCSQTTDTRSPGVYYNERVVVCASGHCSSSNALAPRGHSHHGARVCSVARVSRWLLRFGRSRRLSRSKEDLASWLGAVRFYQSLLPGLSIETAIFAVLLQPHHHFHWDDNFQRAFDRIKQLTLNYATLSAPRDVPCRVYIDASHDAIGLVIEQLVDGQPRIVALGGRKMSQSSCWVRSLYIYTYYDSFDCAFGFDSCSVLFCSLLFFFYTGMEGGLHKSFNVKGSRTPASAWLNACRLARRGFIVILVDEYNSSKVTGDFCLQTHRLNATKLQIRCVRVALKSSFIDRFERCVFVFFAVYRKANCVVLVLFWLASIDLRNKGMPNRRCRS
jgi:hypothetical protein